MRKHRTIVCLAVVFLTSTSVSSLRGGDEKANNDQKAAWSFDSAKEGGVPDGWRVAETNPGPRPADWAVIQDDTAPSGKQVFALTKTENRGHTFNLAIAKGPSLADLELTVKVKGVSGVEDQGGGPIWRCKDENNYYICRFNPLESNYRVYEVVDGRRQQLQTAEVKTEAGKWYTVKVTMKGNSIKCWLDDQLLLEAESETFKDAGMVGLWTKADAVTSFDDLEARPLEED